MLTFGGHLEVLRQMAFRILGVTCAVAIAVFCLKDTTWHLLLAPSQCDFVTYSWTERILHTLGMKDFHFEDFHIKLIATNLTSQFMTHLTTSIYLGLLIASPYILYELFCFISPALFDRERRYSIKALIAVYCLFIIGILISYFILFPVSFRFLGTYSVSEQIESTITIDSYISTFITLSLLMGVVFQLPVVSFILGKMGIVNSKMLSKYRKHAFIVILFVAAVITPGQDIFSLALITFPLYLLYEISIRVVEKIDKSPQ